MRRKTIAAEIAKAAAEIKRPRFLRLVATILVHERRPPSLAAGKCPCCGSPDASISEDIPAADLIIDLHDGTRLKPEDVSESAWEARCAVAQLHEIKIRCSRAQLPMLLDETGRHIYCSAGNRSGKTTLALNWLVLMWCKFGGPLMRFWLVAPKTEAAFKLLKKLILGSRKGTGILPPALIQSAPETHRASNLVTTLVDGSFIDLKFFHGDPGAEQLKSDPVIAAVIDEAAHLPGPDSLAALKGRCLDYHGRLFFSSTPRPSTFLREHVYNPAAAFTKLPDDDPVKISGAHPGAIWNFVRLTVEDNPWMPLDEVQKALRTANPDDPATRRDLFGEWISNNGLFWEHKFDTKRHIVQHEKRDVAKFSAKFMASIGCDDHVIITGDVVKRVFPGRNPHYRMAKATNERYILGHDHNFDPMNECVLQVTAPRGKEKEPDYWHIWVVGTIQLSTRSTLEYVQHLKSVPISRAFDPDGHGSPFEGCGVIVDATAVNYDQASMPGLQRGSFAETYGKLGFDARGPEYRVSQSGHTYPRNPKPSPPNYTLIGRLLDENRLHILQNANPLLVSFDEQEDSGLGSPIDGRVGKWDQIAGPMDAFRYPVWAIMNSRGPVTMSRM